MSNKNCKLKPVSFNMNNSIDNIILDYIEENDLKFSVYVKQLILKDIDNKNNNDKIADAINRLSSIIADSNIVITENNNSSNNANSNNNIDSNSIDDTHKDNNVKKEKNAIINKIRGTML